MGLGPISDLHGLKIATKNYILACYVMHLCMGNNLVCRSIKADTIEAYLQAATSYFTSQGRPSPAWDGGSGRASIINDILVEARRWETIANRREPLTWKMVSYQQRVASSFPPNSLDAALADWFIVGMFAGFRLSEWAQPRSYLSKTKAANAPVYQLGRHQDSLAITAADIEFGQNDFGNFFSITWRYQKNGQNGEKLLFQACPAYPDRCPHLAIKRILQRASVLNIPNDVPLAWYADSTSIHLITDEDIARVLQAAALHAHGVTDPEELSRWTSHSIRVGACVALHESGASTTHIQNSLRWRSDTFKMYLRHTSLLAFQHTNLLASTGTAP